MQARVKLSPRKNAPKHEPNAAEKAWATRRALAEKRSDAATKANQTRKANAQAPVESTPTDWRTIPNLTPGQIRAYKAWDTMKARKKQQAP
jgi:hypothetical protein